MVDSLTKVVDKCLHYHVKQSGPGGTGQFVRLTKYQGKLGDRFVQVYVYGQVFGPCTYVHLDNHKVCNES